MSYVNLPLKDSFNLQSPPAFGKLLAVSENSSRRTHGAGWKPASWGEWAQFVPPKPRLRVSARCATTLARWISPLLIAPWRGNMNMFLIFFRTAYFLPFLSSPPFFSSPLSFLFSFSFFPLTLTLTLKFSVSPFEDDIDTSFIVFLESCLQKPTVQLEILSSVLETIKIVLLFPASTTSNTSNSRWKEEAVYLFFKLPLHFLIGFSVKKGKGMCLWSHLNLRQNVQSDTLPHFYTITSMSLRKNAAFSAKCGQC